MFHVAAKAAGLDIKRPYDLRHAAASLWIMEGNHPPQVAAWMGHNVSETYKTYTHVIEDLDPTDKRTAAQMIEDARQDNHRTISGVRTSP